MAISLSILLSLIAGIYIMFESKYFWGKEDNININSINATMTNLNSFFNIGPLIIIIVVVIGISIMMCTARGF